MITLLSAVLVYVVVFGIDYLFYVKHKDTYKYISLRTYMLFVAGQVAVIGIFYKQLAPFLVYWQSEVAFLSIFTAFLLLFTYVLIRDQLHICSMSSRSLRCLTPWYVLVKGAEIVFQQLIYLVIALTLTSLLGLHFYTYIAYMLILLIIHVVVIIGGGQSVVRSLTFGLFAISVPIFYLYTEMQVFWPAVYLHSIMYVFYWLTIADFDGAPPKVEQNVEKSG